MKKEMQKEINEKIQDEYEKINNELLRAFWDKDWKRFRTCNAWTIETENYIVLKSYFTVVAAINKNTHICYDFLRMVYGFTSTSCQHISKFFSDFGYNRWRSEETIYTWRDI